MVSDRETQDSETLKEPWAAPVEARLIPGEMVLLEMGCDPKAARNSALFIAGGCAVIGFWLLLIPVIVAPFVVMHAISKAKNSGLVLTNRAVFYVQHDSVKSMKLDNITDVHDSGAGAFTVTGKGGSKMTFEHLRNAARAARRIRELTSSS